MRGAVQAVLEREPHAEVRRQTQGRDQLRASDLSALRRSGRHDARYPRTPARSWATFAGP